MWQKIKTVFSCVFNLTKHVVFATFCCLYFNQNNYFFSYSYIITFFLWENSVHASHATPSPPPRRFWSPIRIPVKLNLIKSVQFSKTGLEPLPPSPGRQNYPLGPPATLKTFSGSAHEWEAGVRLWYAWFSVCMDIQKCGKRLVF